MNCSVKNIEQLLLETNRNAHEGSECIECTAGASVQGGRWIKKSEISSQKEIGQPVYMDEENILLYPISHNIIIGSTGSGKTTVLYDNYIDFYSKLPKSKRPSFLVLDLKGDMYMRHTKELEKAGYKVRVLDMRNAFFSAGYNPLSSIYDFYEESLVIDNALKEDKIDTSFNGKTYKSKEQARNVARARYFELRDAVDRYITEIAEIFVINTDPKNLSWTEGGRNCLKAILHTMLRDSETPKFGMTKEKFTIKNVCKTAFTTEDGCEVIIDWLRRADDIPVVSGALGACYDIKATVTRDGYVSSLNAELNKFSSLSVSALTAKSDIIISEIAEGEEDYAVFLIPDSRVQCTNNIASMFINDLVNSLTDKADKNPSRSLDKDFIILADEMGNMPKLPGISNKISSLRSRKIWMQMAVQSLEQLDEVYGEKVSATIIDNCDIHLFLGCNNDSSKTRFAQSMGEKIGITLSANIGNGGIATLSEVTKSIPVVRKSDLDLLKLGEFYVKARVGTNLKASMIPYFLRTDVSKEQFEYELEYNGFEPNANIYSIKEVLKLSRENDDDDDDDIYTSRRPIKPPFQQKPISQTETEFMTDIDRAIPRFSLDLYFVSNPKNMSAEIKDIIKNGTKDENEYNEKLEKLKQEKILPKAIQNAMFDSAFTDSPRKNEKWKLYYKRDLLYDATLRQVAGKEKAIEELNRRINVINDLACFPEDFKQLYREVLSCIEKMNDTDFSKYVTKVRAKNMFDSIDN